MYLYLITKMTTTHIDSYENAIVVAANEDEAKLIHPDEGTGEDWWLSDVNAGYIGPLYTWCKPEDVGVELIGTTDLFPAGSVIMAEFLGV